MYMILTYHIGCSLSLSVYIYIYIYTYICIHIYSCVYIYIYIHREREREILRHDVTTQDDTTRARRPRLAVTLQCTYVVYYDMI